MITTQTLIQLSDVVKITQLARKAGLNFSTILSKVRDNRALTTTESRKIEEVLQSYNLKIEPEVKKEFSLKDYAHLTPAQLLELPRETRNKILSASAELAAQDYEMIDDPTDIFEH